MTDENIKDKLHRVNAIRLSSGFIKKLKEKL